jgi:hypothetical protein
MWLSAGVAALGTLISLVTIRGRPVERPDAAAQPEAAATADAVPVAR